MPATRCADVVMYVCCNCIPQGVRLPRQWKQNGLQIQIHEIPCSGKIDAQYLFHAIEGGARAVGVIVCPQGECQLAQGNYRAEIRVQMVQRLLTEIGLDPQRVELIHCSPADPAELIEQRMREAVDRFAALSPNPIAAKA